MKADSIIPINIEFSDGARITAKAKVIKINDGVAEVEFVDMPESVANQMMYRCFKKSNAKKDDKKTAKKTDKLASNTK